MQNSPEDTLLKEQHYTFKKQFTLAIYYNSFNINK